MSATCPSPAARVQAARAEIAAQVQAYRDLVGAASKASGMSLVRIDAALATFEPAFFGNLLLALERRFAGRLPDADARDAAALVEVRLLAAALAEHGGVLAAEPGTAYDAARSVLGLDVGDRVALNADDFEALAAAFLATVERLSSD
jgi:hypothetical protein